MSRRQPRPAASYLLAMLLLAGSLACTSEETTPAAPSPTHTSAAPSLSATAPAPTSVAPAPTATRTVNSGARPFADDARAQALQVLARVGELWGQPPRVPVATYVIDRDSAIEDWIAGYNPEERELLRLQSQLYGLLGLIPDGTDYFEVFLDLLRFGILGYYEPDLKAFFLLDDLGGVNSPDSQSTIVHEIAHALQDEYYDINKLYEERKQSWDAITAISHLIEGNAVATEAAYYGRAVRGRPACFALPGFARGNPPYTISRELNSWYDDGLCFVNAVAPVLADQVRLFESPPLSTEQVLHPDKYRAGERPQEVLLPALAAALGEGWRETGRSTLGEFTLQNLLIQGLGSDRGRVQSAAAGWGGDAWAFYENGPDRAFHGILAWDTAEDAAEFWSALVTSLAGRGAIATSGTSLDLQVDGKAWRGALAGASVTLVVAGRAEDAQRLAAAAGLP